MNEKGDWYFDSRNPDRVRGADVVFISHARLPGGLPSGFLDVAPELIVEVVSPNDRWQDLREKLKEYFGLGVNHVWVVEPGMRSVLVYQNPTTLRQSKGDAVLEGEGLLSGFTLPLIRLFNPSQHDE